MADPSLEQRIAVIEARNAKVSSDKAWETSATRRLALGVIIYIVSGFMLVLLGSSVPWFYAFIPVVGYLMSTLTLPFIRQIWQTSFYDKKQ